MSQLRLRTCIPLAQLVKWCRNKIKQDSLTLIEVHEKLVNEHQQLKVKGSSSTSIKVIYSLNVYLTVNGVTYLLKYIIFFIKN